ncbi:protease stability complex PrcB-like protein [Keratinibaculum paraultunense]|uniref:Protease stability complex PrcB-like protein n=1 Tax=Keratinibaculum paraultunense TaxID=1278232 RepID=A0A4R3L4L4_9FIRM|nr:protease complex subunit PrcB family protein [Keratinibaculum paraultunense]QQY80040.1 protease complex subunit PrcB family protein [Keratinibaculum paraultunense]TCS91639.1 protease stability complex PrcB-like protein [Keratinibaculum paraultunense]
MNKKYIIIGIIIVVLLGFLLIPKYMDKGEIKVKYKVLEKSEIPEKIREVLPKYLTEERALACRYDDEIYIIVTRGEKNTGGYSVEIDKIVKEQKNKDQFDLIVYAKFKDPDVNDIVTQNFTYPFVIAKTDLKEMPENIKLEIEYEN